MRLDKANIASIIKKIGLLKIDYRQKHPKEVTCLYTQKLLDLLDQNLDSPTNLIDKDNILFLDRFIKTCEIFQPGESLRSYYHPLQSLLSDLRNMLTASPSSLIADQPKENPPTLISHQKSSMELNYCNRSEQYTILNPVVDFKMDKVVTNSIGKRYLSKAEYDQIEQWITDGVENSAPPLELSMLRLDSSPDILRPPLIHLAADWTCNRSSKLLTLAKSGANINIFFRDRNPLMEAVNDSKSTKILKLLIQAGANPNCENEEGLTPFIKAIISNKQWVIDCFSKNKEITWKPTPRLADFKNLNRRLEDRIISEYRTAQEKQKPLLIVILERHNTSECQLIQAMVANIINDLEIKKCYVECDKISQSIVGFEPISIMVMQKHKFHFTPIDINRTSILEGISEQGMRIREQGMKQVLLELENGSGMCILGGRHGCLFKDPEIQKKFHIYSIVTIKKAQIRFSNFSSYEREYLESCDNYAFEEKIMHSKEIVDFFKEIYYCYDPESLYPLLVKNEIIKLSKNISKQKVEISSHSTTIHNSLDQCKHVKRSQNIKTPDNLKTNSSLPQSESYRPSLFQNPATLSEVKERRLIERPSSYPVVVWLGKG